MDNVKKYQVTICDHTYTIVSDQSKESIEKSAALVHDHMQEIQTKSPSLEKSHLAVLSALQIASELIQKKSIIKKMHQQENDLLDKIDLSFL